MCGIVGRLGFGDEPRPVDRDLLVRMRDTMVHRGPDGSGDFVSSDGRVGLAHRRLSIVDLSETASQPMSSHDGRYTLTFNGEIYNHAEIRSELCELSSRPWKTDHSDTEVILHAFEEWGIECVARFRGMFAFGIWDSELRELWLVRDRVGIKPLYYARNGKTLSFASEIKAILADREQKREVCQEAFYHYLSFLTSPAPLTLFEGVRKLPAGTWARVSISGEVEEHRYWDPWDHAKKIDASADEVSELVLEELKAAVDYRKVGDVPVGVFLSGGVDSSANAALFSRGGGEVKTFSIGFKGDYKSYPNELKYARQVADLLGADQNEVELELDDLLSFLPDMVNLQDEPIADPVCVPLYYVSKLAREHGVKVCQAGEGADELFCGYRFWNTQLSIQSMQQKVPKFLKKLALGPISHWQDETKFSYEYLRRGSLGQPIFWGGAEAFTEVHKQRLLSDRLRKQFAGYSSFEAIRPIRERFEEKAWEPSNLNWMTTLDLNLRLPELLLMRLDKMCMGVSLEGRVPFLDHKLVELALSIPTKTKLGGRKETKPVLKKSVRGLIPDEIIDRRKQGFNFPVHEWFLEGLGDMAKRELLEFCEETDFLNVDEVLKLFEGNKPSSIWYLLNFALWWKQYIKG